MIGSHKKHEKIDKRERGKECNEVVLIFLVCDKSLSTQVGVST